MKRKQLVLTGALLLLAGSTFAYADTAQLADVTLATDAATLRRGAETMITVCQGCHDLKYIRYRNLLTLGVDRDTLNTWRGDNDMNAPLLSMTPADMARASYGKAPPNLSLITATRKHGGRFVYSVLTGFYNDGKGKIDNHAFPNIAMPDVLGYSFASQAQRRQIERTAADVASFLKWAAEPNAAFRMKLGTAVIFYLVILTALLYLWKRRIWKDVDHNADTSSRES